jgi:hypothetical protein
VRSAWRLGPSSNASINADTSDHAGPTVRCDCGTAARAGRRSKTFATVLGDMTLDRAYYHCDACDGGCCPRDRALRLRDSSRSPGVLRMVGLVGAMASFEEGHELLHALGGVAPTKHVERAAESLGREMAQDERHVVEPPPADEPVAPTLYLGTDGPGLQRSRDLTPVCSGKVDHR